MQTQESIIRDVTLHAKGGSIRVRFESDAATFIELQTQVADEFSSEYGNDIIFDPNRMKAVVSGLDITLEADTARLPDTDFNLFYLPRKTDSGFDRYEALAEIRQIIEANPDAYDFFNEGRNITNKSNNDVRDLLDQWNQTHRTQDAGEDILQRLLTIESRLDELEAKVEDCEPANVNRPSSDSEYENMLSKFKSYR